jgi:uncharacterized membrane protein
MEPVDNPFNYKWGVFYFNKDDVRTVVPKRTRSFGWTLNFARWGSYAFVIVVLASVILSILLSR